MIWAKVLAIFAVLGVALISVAAADMKSCDQMLEFILTKRQKVVDQSLSNWDKFYELSGESLSSDRLVGLALLRECMELYQKGDAWDTSRRRSQERMRDIELKLAMAEDRTKLRHVRHEVAQLLATQ